MGKEAPQGFGIGDIRRQFSGMGKRIRDFSQTISDHIAQSNTLPCPAAEASPLSGNRPVGKPVHEFPSFEDYVFFALLSILNTRICEDIFEPFHPAASLQENARYGEEYSAMIGTCKLMANWHVRKTYISELGRWRSQEFSSIDSQVGPDRVAILTLGWAGTIYDELTQALESLTIPVSVPESFVSDLRPILEIAYAWNGIVKQELLVCDLKPFVVRPSEMWNPERMKSFERLRKVIRPDSKVVSSVSLGIYRSVSQGSEGRGSRVSGVEQKAKVLVEEWFSSSADVGSPDGSPPLGPQQGPHPPPAPHDLGPQWSWLCCLSRR